MQKVDAAADEVEKAVCEAVAQAPRDSLDPPSDVPPAVRRQALAEFRAWKKTLMDMIKRGARIEWTPEGTYKFVIPKALVRAVWGATIKTIGREGLDGALRGADPAPGPEPAKEEGAQHA